MKKLGKKVSFLTKIMLVVGLLISNLSSLSVVFAAEVTLDVTVVNDKLNIKYLDELAEKVKEVRVDVYEKYTYLDTTFDEVEKEYILTSEELDMLVSSEEEKVLVVDRLLSDVVFDGTYDVKVEIVDITDETNKDGEVIDSREVSMEVLHDSGLEVSVVDATTGLEIKTLENGQYPIDSASTQISVVAKVLAGGLSPNELFMYNEEEYFAKDLIELSFGSEKDFNGYLYGEHTLPVEVKLLNSDLEEVVYSSNVNVLYETYAKNTSLLNTATETLELNELYQFYGNDKDGVLYVLLNEEKVNTMLDLYNLMNLVVGEDGLITYVLSNSEYEDVLEAYNDIYNVESTEIENSEVVVANTEVEEVTIEEFLETILLDDTTMLSLVNEGLTITYRVVVAGDLDNDNVLTETDLSELVNQVIGEADQNLEKSDVNKDGIIDTLDVMHLDQVMKNKIWDVELIEEAATLDAGLEVKTEDIISGDEFTVEYVLTLSDYAVNGVSGIFNYDTTKLELVSVEASDEWLGNANNSMFLYLRDESLTGTETEGEDGEVVVNPEKYVVLTATFRALMAGTSLISVETPEYFDHDTYLLVEEVEISTEVVVNASDNNNLKSLIVGGQSIELIEDVLDYELTVKNEVTSIDIDAIPEIEGVTAISIISPEELVEGANEVIITVVSETGNEKVYTVTVIREEAPKEETTTTPVNYNNYYNDYEEEDSPSVVIPEIEEDDDKDDTIEEEKESNVSRIIIIILILLVIAGLIYLIFKDEDDTENKKTNKDINKLKKEVKQSNNKSTNKTNGNSKTKNTKSKKSNN